MQSVGLEQSLETGFAAIADGRDELGLRWLDRAARLAPNSPLTAFMLATAQVKREPAEARERLATLIANWPDFLDAHFALAGATFRQGDAAAAAEALSVALHRFRAPPHPDFHRLATEISLAADAPGWVSLGGAMILSVSVMRRGHPALLEVGQAGTPLHRRILPIGPPRTLRLQLPPNTRRRDAISATLDGVPLLGSLLSPAVVLRVEALVQPIASGRLRGYAWMPGVPETRPVLLVRTPGASDHAVTVAGTPKLLAGHPLARVRAFSLPAPAGGVVHVLGPDGRDVPGSPVYPTPLPPPRLPAAQPGLDVVIPVFRGAADLAACLASLRKAAPTTARIVLVDDGSTDPDLLHLLQQLATGGRCVVLRHAENRGFPAAVNTGLLHAAGRDVLLLNPDTLLPKDAVARLRAAAYAEPDIGSATPLSNEASVVSYPDADGGNPAPRGDALSRLDRLCQAVNRGCRVDLPSAVGFCMYVRGDCLAETGGFRADVFAQGYGEENEWCRRAAALGWRHVAAAGIFVSHLGGRSFGPARIGLMARNGAVLNRLHPGYDALVQRFLQQGGLPAARRRLDMARWQAAGSGPLVLLVSHNLGGGVTRFVEERCQALHAAGRRTLVVRPDGQGALRLHAAADLACPNLRFQVPDDWQLLVTWLRKQRAERVELHHAMYHVPGVERLAQVLRVPLDVYVHDNIFFCPRLTLLGRSGRYCGEPVDPAVCDACVAELGSAIPDAPPVATLRAQSGALFAAASQVVVPCQDVARRVRRYTQAVPVVRPWQDDTALPPRIRVPPGPLRVAVVGALNQDKGMDVLRDCARAAADRRLPIEFVLIGFSVDDEQLIQAGVFVTGRFAPDEAASLLRREKPGVGFVPSVVPETWCYALTTMWEAGLDVLSFDVGAQAERTRATGRGRLLPLGVSSDRVLTMLAAMQSARV